MGKLEKHHLRLEMSLTRNTKKVQAATAFAAMDSKGSSADVARNAAILSEAQSKKDITVSKLSTNKKRSTAQIIKVKAVRLELNRLEELLKSQTEVVTAS